MTNPYRAALKRLMNTIHDLRLEGGNAELKVALNTARALLAEAVAVGPTDEELEATAREAEVHSLKQQGGLGGDANNMAQQMQRQRIAGLRAVLARFGRPAAALAEPEAEEPTDDELDEFALFWWGLMADERTVNDVIECCSMTAFARAVLARWGHPTPEATNE